MKLNTAFVSVISLAIFSSTSVEAQLMTPAVQPTVQNSSPLTTPPTSFVQPQFQTHQAPLVQTQQESAHFGGYGVPANAIQYPRDDGNGLPSRNRHWVDVEYLFGSFNSSGALIGSSNAPQSFQEFRSVTANVLSGAKEGGAALDANIVGESLDESSVHGVRLSFGMRNANDGGYTADLFWLDDSTQSWSRGLGGLNGGAETSTIRVTAALPLDDGNNGYAVPYDQWFKISIRSSMKGLGAHYAPFGNWVGATLFQPTIGVRAIDLDEAFGFEGADSGLTYVHNANGLPDPTTLNPPVVGVPPYQSILNSNVESMGVGLQLGLNYTTSGKRFRIGGATRVGLMVMDSSMTLDGRGIGNGFGAGFDPLATFSESQSDTYGAAVFEQQLFADIEIGTLLPIIRDMRNAHDTTLRLGWSFMAINDVVRPLESIDWRGAPLTPQINSEKEKLTLSTLNIGLIFKR